jgi:hypothetical protein
MKRVPKEVFDPISDLERLIAELKTPPIGLEPDNPVEDETLVYKKLLPKKMRNLHSVIDHIFREINVIEGQCGGLSDVDKAQIDDLTSMADILTILYLKGLRDVYGDFENDKPPHVRIGWKVERQREPLTSYVVDVRSPSTIFDTA